MNKKKSKEIIIYSFFQNSYYMYSNEDSNIAEHEGRFRRIGWLHYGIKGKHGGESMSSLIAD